MVDLMALAPAAMTALASIPGAFVGMYSLKPLVNVVCAKDRNSAPPKRLKNITRESPTGI